MLIIKGLITHTAITPHSETVCSRGLETQSVEEEDRQSVLKEVTGGL